MSELKRPCPWCAGTAGEVRTERCLSSYFSAVECSNCSARGPSVANGDPEKAERDALEAWEDV